MKGVWFWLICWLIGLISGYLLGRSGGLREGERIGSTHAPLALRAETLLSGFCPVCERELPIKPPGSE